MPGNDGDKCYRDDQCMQGLTCEDCVCTREMTEYGPERQPTDAGENRILIDQMRVLMPLMELLGYDLRLVSIVALRSQEIAGQGRVYLIKYQGYDDNDMIDYVLAKVYLPLRSQGLFPMVV